MPSKHRRLRESGRLALRDHQLTFLPGDTGLQQADSLARAFGAHGWTKSQARLGYLRRWLTWVWRSERAVVKCRKPGGPQWVRLPPDHREAKERLLWDCRLAALPERVRCISEEGQEGSRKPHFENRALRYIKLSVHPEDGFSSSDCPELVSDSSDEGHAPVHRWTLSFGSRRMQRGMRQFSGNGRATPPNVSRRAA